jgi:hypothetical protein
MDMKKLMISIYLFVCPILLFGQSSRSTDSIPTNEVQNLHFSKRQLIVPAVFFGYGIASMESDYLKLVNTEIREEVQENIDEKFTIDDFSQFTPVLTVYGLNLLGCKGKNNFRDRTVIFGTSFLLMSTTVLSLKKLTHVERPDGSSNNSFPSGHTANAFAGAEFLYQEYKDVSPWIGAAGFAVAAGTGFFRIYNNRHWLSDVMMGAGIGILSTKVAYWTFPFIDSKILRSGNKIHSQLIPFYNGKQTGLELVFCLQ